ncbi:uncharacterized protein LOC141712336 [Apium graveolens]|uniref:uncharacterized protein LOC141712336 n=1 Tax=Apium graveolens TaxID=4045 RepID=UPI003D7B2804
MEKSSPSSSSSSLDRKSSIEREPRTINIDFAREQAIYVVNTRSVEEALTIFTKGLQPVTCCRRVETSDMTNIEEEEERNCTPAITEMFEMRKIGSAPF